MEYVIFSITMSDKADMVMFVIKNKPSLMKWDYLSAISVNVRLNSSLSHRSYRFETLESLYWPIVIVVNYLGDVVCVLATMNGPIVLNQFNKIVVRLLLLFFRVAGRVSLPTSLPSYWDITQSQSCCTRYVCLCWQRFIDIVENITYCGICQFVVRNS